MSFSGPTAPPNADRESIPADLFRLLLALLIALGVTAIGAAGLFVSTLPAWISYCVQPFSMLLIPGYLVESLDHNTYAFSTHNVLAFSCLIYFAAALLVLFRRPAGGVRSSARRQPLVSRQTRGLNR